MHVPKFFQDLAAELGWTEHTMLEKACEFISATANSEGFCEFLQYAKELERELNMEGWE